MTASTDPTPPPAALARPAVLPGAVGGGPGRERTASARAAAAGPRNANMTDVARRAGVSHMTVSRVLNGSPSVRAGTRDRVLAAIEELGYRRNSAARTLVTRRSQRLGVIGFDSTLYGPAQMLHGIERSARAAGYFVTVASQEIPDVQAVERAYERLTEQSVEGVVVIAQTERIIDALTRLAPDLPCVAVLAGTRSGFPSVSFDQVRGARLATRHLLDQGASTVWHVSGPAGFYDASDRSEGWRRELDEAGLAVPDPLEGDWTPASGYAAGRVLAARPDVEAVFAANDQMALGVLRALAEAGRRVPQDVRLVGFDDIPEAAYLTPPLTTVRQDFSDLGRRSLDLLLDQLGQTQPDGPQPEGRDAAVPDHLQIVVPPELLLRESSLPGRAHRPREGTRVS